MNEHWLDQFNADTKVIDKALDRGFRLERAVNHAIAILEEHSDASDGQPNWAMALATDLKEALHGPGNFR